MNTFELAYKNYNTDVCTWESERLLPRDYTVGKNSGLAQQGVDKHKTSRMSPAHAEQPMEQDAHGTHPPSRQCTWWSAKTAPSCPKWARCNGDLPTPHGAHPYGIIRHQLRTSPRSADMESNDTNPLHRIALCSHVDFATQKETPQQQTMQGSRMLAVEHP